jgi:chemotaxis signal transduction protein
MSNPPLGDFLLVRTGAGPVGLLLEDVLEVSNLPESFTVPTNASALRGVTLARGRLVPLVHLGAFLTGGQAPAERGATLVLVGLGEHGLGLEVDEADILTRQALLPVPEDQSLPWARSVVRREDGLVPILNLNSLRERLAESGAAA